MRLAFCKYLESPKDLELPQVTAARIRDLDDYYGYLAWTEVFMHDNLLEKGVHVLQELIRCFPTRPEAYFKLWQHYNNNSFHSEALQIATECFLRVSEYPEYAVITSLNLAKSNFKLGNIAKALEILQQKHIQKPTFSVYLYAYGKFCIKFAESAYVYIGIGALKEAKKNCDKSRIKKINFWLFKGHILLKQTILAIKKLAKCAKKKFRSVKKTEEIKNELKKYSKIIQNLQTAEEWIENEKDDRFEKFKGICEEIKLIDELQGNLLIAKGLWKLGKESESIEHLLNTISGSDLPQGYFLVLKYLFIKEDFRTAKRISKAMLNKSKNSEIQVWIKAHIFYAYSLFHNSKPSKAILLLKCMGKVFPFLPYTFTPYIQQLRKANCLDDLNLAAERASDSSVNFKETSFQLDNVFTPDYILSINDHKQSNIEICNKLIAEDSIITESNSSRGFKTLNLSEVFNKFKNYKETDSSCNSISSEKVFNIMKIYEKNTFVCYSISSKPKFLYLIGKFSAISSINLDDGLCAIEDYLNLIRNDSKKRKLEVKALIVKAKLLILLKDFENAKETLNDTLEISQHLNMESKQSQILSLLATISNN